MYVILKNPYAKKILEDVSRKLFPKSIHFGMSEYQQFIFYDDLSRWGANFNRVNCPSYGQEYTLEEFLEYGAYLTLNKTTFVAPNHLGQSINDMWSKASACCFIPMHHKYRFAIGYWTPMALSHTISYYINDDIYSDLKEIELEEFLTKFNTIKGHIDANK